MPTIKIIRRFQEWSVRKKSYIKKGWCFSLDKRRNYLFLIKTDIMVNCCLSFQRGCKVICLLTIALIILHLPAVYFSEVIQPGAFNPKYKYYFKRFGKIDMSFRMNQENTPAILLIDNFAICLE